jgi:hypothetical protein
MKKSAAVFIAALALEGSFHVSNVSADTMPIEGCMIIPHSGTWVLTKNITSNAGTCLEIQADNVTIDLAGFMINGNLQAYGIQSTGATGATARQNITVRNGTITNSFTGVLLFGSGHIVERLRVVNSLFDGIVIDGGPGIVRDNLVLGNRVAGISASGILSGNFADGNQILGIEVSGYSVVNGNTSRNNAGRGFVIEAESTVTGNVAVLNGGRGFEITCRSLVMNNTAQDNFENLTEFGSGPFRDCINIDNVTIPPP